MMLKTPVFKAEERVGARFFKGGLLPMFWIRASCSGYLSFRASVWHGFRVWSFKASGHLGGFRVHVLRIWG